MHTPADLIAARVSAFQLADFAFIYDSYLPKAPFRNFFPSRSDYLAYARDEILPRIRIVDFCVLRCEIQGEHATLLIRQSVAFDHAPLDIYEICKAERLPPGAWYYHSGLKLDPLLISPALFDAGWDEMAQAGADNIWI